MPSVPVPPFESALPCWHKCVEDSWFSGDRLVGGLDEDLADGGLERDVDRYVIPEGFVWDVQKVMRAAPMDVREYESRGRHPPF